MSSASTATIFLLLAIAATTTFCHQESEKLENFRTQTDQASEALALNVKSGKGLKRRKPNGKLLTSWNPANSKADYVVAQDGSGTHKTINDALAALDKTGGNRRNQRVIVYVKAGVYNEKVVIKKNMEKLMFVGDGIDRTIVTGNRNAKRDGYATHETATFGVHADGFWARDMTFENTAGPDGRQAVALMVSSEQSVVYRCSFKGYQNTLYVRSKRQFYRDCHIYGTIDFIFGNAAVVLQNCDIFVRKPNENQKNVIVAQGRRSPDENTGISIQGSRIRPAPDFIGVKNIPTFLGRPWRKYSRTVIFETDIDGFIDPAGWLPWDGSVHLNTLFYAEYNNIGCGASTEHRAKWPGFHVFKSWKEASPFTVNKFIKGSSWISQTGVSYKLGV
ncbi:pectinesterase/pectinesterase inhibitor 36 [Populus alba x Populus x berolinensis]|uniref:Pectinesterase n=1 Tax=Populus alba x Populus x berolinensis TaxID=444605 RepID=A0AAD6REF5_9ROSI|nr:pectinesterase/pectinesterase inhibitor 36 [Populus alba x Populus x berolinensis]